MDAIYGLNGYKVHSKLCLITRKTEKGLSYITQIGTGNYIEKTSRLHTGLSLITANPQIGQEAAYIAIKINSLTDKGIIEKLVEASQAGVTIELIIRGICCLIPGIEGYTDNITVISIVGRFLEHSRIYRFGTKEREKVYIASADYMTRNTVRRVEVAAPILDEQLKEKLDRMFETMMRDDEKGKCMTTEGSYADRGQTETKLDSQEYFYEMSYLSAQEKDGEK